MICRRRHFGIGADAPAGCHGGKFVAAGVLRLDQVHHQGVLRGPVCRCCGVGFKHLGIGHVDVETNMGSKIQKLGFRRLINHEELGVDHAKLGDLSTHGVNQYTS